MIQQETINWNSLQLLQLSMNSKNWEIIPYGQESIPKQAEGDQNHRSGDGDSGSSTILQPNSASSSSLTFSGASFLLNESICMFSLPRMEGPVPMGSTWVGTSIFACEGWGSGGIGAGQDTKAGTGTEDSSQIVTVMKAVRIGLFKEILKRNFTLCEDWRRAGLVGKLETGDVGWETY